MKMDLCVFLAGNDLSGWTPMFFETLRRKCKINELEFHVVEKGTFTPREGQDGEPVIEDYVPGVGDNVHKYLLRLKEELGVPFTIYEKHDVTEFMQDLGPWPPRWQLAADHANTMNWAIENCGTNNWIVFCHSDVIFIGDIISALEKHINDRSGMLGVHSHLLAVNREAFFKIGLKFNSISAFYAVPAITGYGKGFHMVRHINDPECIDKSIPLFGWDTAELVRMLMIAYGWLCDIYYNPEFLKCMLHGGSGHGYARKELRESMSARLDAILAKFGIVRL